VLLLGRPPRLEAGLIPMQLFFLLLQLVLPLIVAYVIHRRVPGWRIFRATIFLPAVYAAVVIGILTSTVLQLGGPLNQALGAVGLGSLEHEWLGNANTSIPLILLVVVWTNFGYNVLLYLAGMSAIDPSLEEAARIDGAGWLRVLRHVIVPDLRRVMEIVLVVNTITAAAGAGSVSTSGFAFSSATFGSPPSRARSSTFRSDTRACPIAGSDGRYMSMVNGPSAVRNDSNNVRPNVPGRSIVYSIIRHVIASEAKQSSSRAPPGLLRRFAPRNEGLRHSGAARRAEPGSSRFLGTCLLYLSDAAGDLRCVVLRGLPRLK